jgi:RNA polymerase sigma factor (sigma-70 family)
MSDIHDQEALLNSYWKEVQQGDARAYSRLHEQLHPLLYRYAWAMLNDGELAADVIQDLFIKLWFRKERTGAIRNVKAFFLTALRRQTLNQLRSLKRLHITVPQEPDIVFSAEDIIIEEERHAGRREKISGYLNQLPKRQKEVIYLYFYEGLSYDEVAAVMNINYQSAVNLAHKAIKQLRGSIGGMPCWPLFLAPFLYLYSFV